MTNENVLKFGREAGKPKSKIGRWLEYFTTNRGRNFSFKFMGGAAIAGSALFHSYQTFFIEEYLDLIRIYRHGKKLEVPEEIELLIDQAADICKLKPVHATHLKSFMVSGTDVKSYGSMNSLYHGYIGVPITYFYRSVHDIDKFNLKFGTESIDWSSNYGELLEKSLVLTDDEKMFGLIRAILELRNFNFVHNSLVPGVMIFGLYVTASTINQKYKLFQIPRGGRVMIYGMLSVFAYGLYSALTDTIKLTQMMRVDNTIASMGSDVIQAGIGFYEKQLNRNIVMREIASKDSLSVFIQNLFGIKWSVKGNEIPGILRYNALPLTTRKKNLEIALEEARKMEKEDAEKGSDSILENKQTTK